MDERALIGAVATAIAFASYVPYFRDIFAGKTRPHAISWLVWGTLTAIGFAGQVAGSAGPGAWATGITALLCLLISLLGFLNGRTDIILVDWLSLAGAAVALVLWRITNDPLLSVIIVTAIYALGYVPTVRKSWSHPHTETLGTHYLSALRSFISLFALTQFTLLTALYPLALFVMNGAFAVMLAVRRAHLARTTIATTAEQPAALD